MELKEHEIKSLEKKAEEYFINVNEHCYADTYEDLKEDVTKAYVDGYKQGQKEILEQCSLNHGENKTCLVERLVKLEKENTELKLAIKDREIMIIKRDNQIEKMKCCFNCRFEYPFCDECNGCGENYKHWELAE